MRLTEKSLAAIVPPPGGRVTVRDDELPGLIVVVGARGAAFYLDAWVGRARRKIPIGRHGVIMPDGLEPWSVARARQRARELVGQLAAGQDPTAPRRRAGAARTLRDGLELHLDTMRRRRLSARSIATLESEVLRLLAAWLDRPIVDLTAGDLNALHRDVRARASARARARLAASGLARGRSARRPAAGSGAGAGAAEATSSANEPGAALANRIVRHVKAIWNALDRVEELPGRNPARGVVPSELRPREARVADDGFAAWWAAVQAVKNPIRRDLYVLALLTGVRSDGLRHLRWDDLDERAGLLHVTRSKGGRPYTIPLGPRALELLAARRAENATRLEKHGGDHGWIFPGWTRARVAGADGTLRRQVVAMPGARTRDRKTGKTASVPVHDLRRTYNSVAIEIGIPPEARAMLMNHERRGVNVRHYGFPQSWTFLAECQARLEAALFERISDDRPQP